MPYNRIIEAVFSSPWAIQPDKMRAIVEFLSIKSSGGAVEGFQAASRSSVSITGGVAVIPVRGTITQRSGFFSEISGASSTEQIGRAIREAVADQDVSAIVLDIDSPGGSVYGVQELAEEIYSLRGQKPIVAVANSLAASAAYWIASAADELVVTPSGEVGSIGVLMMHVDESGLNEKVGLNPTYIYAGEYKVEGNPDEPLSDEAMAFLKQRVGEYYDAFVGAVARNRGVTSAVVESDYGQGRVFGSAQALNAGMVDKVETLAATIERMRPRGTPRLARAKTEFL